MRLQHILCLVALLACATPCAAQISSGPFAAPSGPSPVPSGPSAVVPLNSWLFVAADTILKTGIPFGSPNGTYAGRRVVTRHEFALATARVLMSSPTLPPEPRSNLVSDVALRLEISPPAVSALIALVHEFSPELSRLGQDVPKATARLEALRQWQEVYNKKIVPTPEQMNGRLIAVPKDTWPLATVQTFKADGIVLSYPDGTYGGRPPVTRFDFALAIARLLIQFPPQPSTPSANLATDLPEWLRRAPLSVSALIALAHEFSPELSRLGQDVPKATARLEALRQWQEVWGTGAMSLHLTLGPFTDIPTDHWAASSVETLRQDGLIAGYPSGAYTTR